MGIKLFSRRAEPATELPVQRGTQVPKPRPETVYEPAAATPLDPDPLRQQLQLERFGVILNGQSRWTAYPNAEEVIGAAMSAIDEKFAMVPEGFASLPQYLIDIPGSPELDVETAPFLLARHNVTNAQYQKFVDAGGYDELELWPKDIWPHLIDFRDLTEESGPRYWRNGRYDQPLAEHPVVGVCYYEAVAYARWAGYRLPSEAEWQMAASWRIRSSAHVMRRYPWGDALDVRRCNIWASGLARTMPVTAFEAGSSPNGVLQLIGNVWEWTSSDFEIADAEGRLIVGDMIMKSIRGGAFDTYFAAQATSTFRTGLTALSRTHNVGIRCAMDLGGDQS